MELELELEVGTFHRLPTVFLAFLAFLGVILHIIDLFWLKLGSLFLFLKNVNDSWKENTWSFLDYSGFGFLGITTISVECL